MTARLNTDFLPSLSTQTISSTRIHIANIRGWGLERLYTIPISSRHAEILKENPITIQKNHESKIYISTGSFRYPFLLSGKP